MRNNLQMLVMLACCCAGPSALGADWIAAPSYYTHDPETGRRVTQYSPIGPFYTYARSDYMRSGYRQTRSSIQVGASMDNMHIVEEWGRPVRPYGEWRFPYRPYSVPYSAWGPPFAGMGYPGYPGYGYPYAGPRPELPYNRGNGGAMGQNPPPWHDGAYPQYPPSRPRQNRPRRPRPPHPVPYGAGAHGAAPGPGGPARPPAGP